MRLTTILLLISITAFGQNVVRFQSWMDAPAIWDPQTITNNTTEEQIYGLMVPPGKVVQITYADIVVVDSVVVPALSYTGMLGVTPNTTFNLIESIDRTDWIKYTVNFKKNRTKLSYTYALSDATPGKVEFRIGSITATPFAVIDLPVTNPASWGTFKTVSVPINLGSDADIYLTFIGSPRQYGAGGNMLYWYVK